MQANLLRDGIERTAEHVMNRIRNERGRRAVIVRKFGKVAVYPAVEVDFTAEAANVVGTYTRDVQPEVVEDDLLARLRELSTFMATLEEPAHG